IAPLAPEGFRACQRIGTIDRWRRTLKGGSVGEDKGNGLTGLDCELADGSKIFARECDRGSQKKPLRTGNRIDRAVIEPVDPWHARSVTEASHELGLKNDAAR